MRRPRVDNWATALRAVIAEHESQPFVWGQSDCSFAFDAVRAITGFDPIESIRGYGSELAALRNLRASGFETTADLVAAHFEEIPAMSAMRGDLGYPSEVRHPLMSPAVIFGAFAYSKSPGEGWVVIETAALTRIYGV